MFDIKWIRDNPDAFDAGRRSRGLEPLSGSLLSLDDRRRAAILRLQAVQERRNAAAKEIGQAMGRKDAETAERLKAEVAGLKAEAPALEVEERDASAALDGALMEIPNLPLPEVPVGADEHGNVEIHRGGQKPGFPDGFVPKEHDGLGEALGLMDFDSAAKLSGARFVVLRGALARLHRALGQYMIDMHVDRHGYEEVDPPVLVRDAAMYGTAQLPKFRDDQFRAGDDHWLIPTAEVPLTNLARERVIDERDLPLRFTALTQCFRKEAGSAGRDTRGMIRQHQFAKVEMVSITTPEASAGEHERMTRAAEDVLEGLGLHYRRMELCTGDMGFASRRTFDLEVWLPGQGTFREISSCSVCGDFQARRMEARYRPTGAKATRFVHTLNGSGVAVGRALVAVLENYQETDGTIAVPEVLRPYMGGLERIVPAKADADMRILITNDDGIHAQGLAVLERIARRLSDDIVVVAPETDQSGVAHSLSLNDPLRLREVSEGRYAIKGTPTDCVIMAVNAISKDRRPDLILSGINRGQNVAEDVTYSGTIAAAMEGTLLGVPSIALSQAYGPVTGRKNPHWDCGEHHAAGTVKRILDAGIPRGTLVNVNFPDCAPDEVAGIEVTRQGSRDTALMEVHAREDGRGNPYYWIGFARGRFTPVDGSDLEALKNRKISVTPLRLDLTDGETRARYAEAFD